MRGAAPRAAAGWWDEAWRHPAKLGGSIGCDSAACILRLAGCQGLPGRPSGLDPSASLLPHSPRLVRSLTTVCREGLLSWKRSPPSRTKSAPCLAASCSTSSNAMNESSLRTSSFSHTPCSQRVGKAQASGWGGGRHGVLHFYTVAAVAGRRRRPAGRRAAAAERSPPGGCRWTQVCVADLDCSAQGGREAHQGPGALHNGMAITLHCTAAASPFHGARFQSLVRRSGSHGDRQPIESAES